MVALRLRNLPPREVLGQCHREGFVGNPRQDHDHTLGIFASRIAVKDCRVATANRPLMSITWYCVNLVGAGER